MFNFLIFTFYLCVWVLFLPIKGLFIKIESKTTLTYHNIFSSTVFVVHLPLGLGWKKLQKQFSLRG